ncbi:pyridoxamine 5'-phosphate oxidase family protein [Streptomyces sp. SL13]|uniref:Pyridoxamine 5'-phosphate oxidase family protein n=1 Tax=Streptantibioticus silvisoli TaxID=2705255 RepID=A0AA90H4A9_9ACTN|nr:pyridoxamine 5'-phosphate oxidase family protein [Streptantibioticus silvisoli]MDI5961935.1 pyridoxamine 5'-phosphate oxidase family protein [Streptantibioticus silvisoli]MDI5970525.1 pyridoxamine 5'-phosphate oxidase family protein [Streptantibioticus silvisoli]
MNQHQHDPAAPAGLPGGEGEHALQRELGTVDRAGRFYDEQVRDRLNTRMREFVARQEMFFLSTSDAGGECDSSLRAGPPGFVLVLDDRTLAYPEYRGNGVMASLGNIKENPHVGLLLVDFGRDRIGLHVNGRARLVPDELMRIWRTDLPVDPVPGRRPQIWVEVGIKEAYIHCSKHIPHLVKAPPAGAASGTADGDRAWGTDDVHRKGGDFFHTAAEGRAAEGRTAEGRESVTHHGPREEPRHPARRTAQPAAPARGTGAPLPGPAPADVAERARLAVRSRADRAGLPDPDMWRREAERALARAHRRDPQAGAVPPAPVHGAGAFRGWFG